MEESMCGLRTASLASGSVGKPVSKELDREQQGTRSPPLACRCAHTGAHATHVTQTYTQIVFDTGSLYVALTGLAVHSDPPASAS